MPDLLAGFPKIFKSVFLLNGMKRGERKGQFYIIAAIIIITILVGAAVLRNYVISNKEQTKVYDLGEELKIETGSVYDYGIYQGTNTDKEIASWAQNYSEYSKGQAVEDWIFVYGNEKGLKALTFTTKTAGQIGIITSTVDISVPIEVGEVTSIPVGSVGNEGVELTFRGVKHNFDLKQGENFFFVIKGGEYTASG